MKTSLLNMVTRTVGRSKLLLIKHAPTLMTYGGIVIVGVGIYLFCKASMQFEECKNEHLDRLDEINDISEKDGLTEKETAKMVFYERRDYAFELVKLYGPAVTTTITGFAMVLGGHHIIHKRNVAISAAYKTLEEGYLQYRKRVREDLGEEKDKEYLYGLGKTKVDAVVTDEDGNERKISKEIYIPGRANVSPYARFFDKYSTQWTTSSEYNLMFLNGQQSYANDKLHAQGHLFLNEVYEMLGLPHTEAGAVVGWVLNKGGDNCVDFGIYDLNDPERRAFVNGLEDTILLDFNVDGMIYDLI